MSGQSSLETKAQLDKAEREHLEDVVTDLRETVEADIKYQLKHTYELDDESGGEGLVGEEADKRAALSEAVEQEDGDKTWEEKFNQYVMGVGYTIVNRLTALRCMEVRDFLDRPVTQFGESGTTPAAEKLENEKYLSPDVAKIEAYNEACKELSNEIKILFDTSSPYSIVEPDVEIFEELCHKLDDVPREVWQADDVLGWVYEYYNRPLVEALDAKDTLEADDVGPANQFYTPHWVVRMLADNSLGKLYLESTGQEEIIPDPESLSDEERKNRLVTPEDSPGIPELCTYLVPDEGNPEAPSFDDPSEIRVIDPACGSGHFLLYVFDILERIWWSERPDLDRSEIPAKILQHNLYGVDIDLRSCQLAAFNLYLKARTRAEEENISKFEMPNTSIVCADARVAEVEEAVDVLDEITGEGTRAREALDEIITEFQTTEALGSLLDVQGMLSEEFMQEQTDLMRWNEEGPHTLNAFLKQLREAVEERTSDSFSEQNLRSFLNLLVVLTQDYDVALMNPPYGMRGRMPDDVKEYVEEHYQYYPEYYVNFYEACDRLAKNHGRVGMLIPWSFMFRKVFESFRTDFVSEDRRFDFLSEFGYDILDNATVGTVGTVVRAGTAGEGEGTFIRLHDVPKADKELKFVNAAFGDGYDGTVQRRFTRDTSEFSLIPGASVSYWVPKNLRNLYTANTVLDADNADLPERQTIGVVKQGLATGDDDRFFRYFWETKDAESQFPPISKGGSDAWLLSRINRTVLWEDDGKEVKRYGGSRPQNTQFYFNEGVTFNSRKRSGRNFGYLHPESVFSHVGTAIFPNDMSAWPLIAYLNSRLMTYLKLAQTFERKWEVSTVARLPVIDAVFECEDELADAAKEQVANVVSKRSLEFTSPHFSGCMVSQMVGHGSPHSPNHPHRTILDEVPWRAPPKVSPDTSFEEITDLAEDHLSEIDANLEKVAQKTDDLLFDYLDIPEEQRVEILQEVGLRTIDDPLEGRKKNNSKTDTPENRTISAESLVKDFLLQLSMDLLVEDDDGIIPLSDVEGESHLLTRIEAKSEQLFGEYASSRLAEIDQLLGSKKADEEAYPNLREWLEDELFEYHISKFDRTPILWRLTTERLVSDPMIEGFSCLVDYHQLNASLFDRIESRYLDPLKAEYRERRAAADQRRSDSTLSTSEQAEAAEEYERCESVLSQITEFQEAALELGSPHPPNRDEAVQSTAAALKPKVAEFRERTAERLDTLDRLVEEMDPDEFEDQFSPTFLERVNENRDEWLSALEDLEAGCEAYTQDVSSPVEAHLHDLFEYIDDNVGSTHYGSNDITFMNYYFSKGEQYLNDGEPRDGLEDEARLMAELAAETDKDVELGEEIKKRCNQLSKALPSEWEERALEEVMASGYSPVKKHGVAVNIRPLAEKNLVPEVVEDKVVN